jgi:hypothetical protein
LTVVLSPRTRHQHHFEDLSPDDFERLLFWLVERSGEFDAVQWYGGARDKGRDVMAYRHTDAGREKWYIRCKRVRCCARHDGDKERLARSSPSLSIDVPLELGSFSSDRQWLTVDAPANAARPGNRETA